MAGRRRKPNPVELGVDEFLAAPDSVRRSDEERRKLEARKAQAQAEEKQLRARKRKTAPSAEDLLADLNRVAADKNLNPHWKFKTLSAKRYRLYGYYPILFVDRRYGTFTHALEVAGLRDKPGTRSTKAAIAHRSRNEHAGRYAERYLLPHVQKHPELEREINDVKLVLSISDTHGPFLDPFTWQVFLEVARDLKPDVVFFNGDILEGSSISRWEKIPGWNCDLQVELDFAREMFKQIREVVPADTRVVWGAGNHGLDRWARYLTQVAPEIAGLRSMRFDELVGLGDLDVTLTQGGKMASPKGTEDDAPGMLLYDCYRIHHGTILGQTPAVGELRVAGRSGQSGHIHRPAVVYGTTEANRTKTWMSTPMGCTPRAGRAYMKGLITGWSKGFGIAFIAPGGVVRHYPVVTDDGWAIVEGYHYRERDDLPEQEPIKNWLVDMPVPK